MTQLMEQPTTSANGNGNEMVPQRAQVQRREIRTVEDHSIVANLMDTARFEHLQRVANLMACSSLLPEHLRTEGPKGNKVELDNATKAANCFRIVNQALRWGMDPFAIIDETYVVGGKLAYQGKLVAAVVNARANLSKRLRYDFSGTGDNLTVTVSGTFAGEDEPRTATLRVGDAKTDNQMWRKDPEQKLIYSGVVKWARRHCPEVVLGVLTDEDIERMQMSSEAPAEAKAADLNRRIVTSRPVSEGQTLVPDDVMQQNTGVAPPVASGGPAQQEQQAPAATQEEQRPAGAATSAPEPEGLEEQLAAMSPEEFERSLYAKAREVTANKVTRSTFSDSTFKFSKARGAGVGGLKNLDRKHWPLLWSSVAANAFDFTSGTAIDRETGEAIAP